MVTYYIKDLYPGFATNDTVYFDCDVVFNDAVTFEDTTFSGNTTIGDASTDTLTIDCATTTYTVSGGALTSAATSISLYGGNTTGDVLVLQGSSADAGQKLTITGASGSAFTGALSCDGNVTLSNNTCTLTHSGTTSLTIASTSGTVIVEAVTFTGAALSGVSTIGASDTLTITDAATAILINNTASKTEGLSITTATSMTLGTGLSISGAGTTTTGILLDATAMTTGISITAGSLTDGIKISGTTPVDGIEISSACSATGINLSGASLVGLGITGATTGISIGNCPTGISFTDAGAATEHLIDVVDAYKGMFIETGTYASDVDKGITLSATNQRPVSFLFDDSADTLGSGNYRALLSRTYIGATQNGAVAIRSIRGQLKVASTKNLDISAEEFSSVNGVEGYIELAGTHTIGATTRVAGTHAFVEVNDDITLTSGGYLAGVFAELCQANTKTVSNAGTMGFLVDKVSSGHSTHQVAWGTGLYIAASSATTGIYIGSCTTGISISGTGTEATSKAFSTSGWTLNNANLTDGYGAVECDLTLTGTSAGHVAALSSWVNMATGTHGAGGNYICAQTNGIWEDSAATITGAKIIYGMRMDCICGDTDAAGYFPFSIVNNANTTTAIFDANHINDIAYTTDAGTASTKIGSIAIAKIGATTYYVRVYDAAN